jgi:hypothetical protein
MNRFTHQWQTLTTLARQAGDDRDHRAPYGFATRIAAQVTALPVGSPWAIMERFALRGLMVAAACSLVAVALNYSSLSAEMAEDYTGHDTVAELLDLS